MYFTVEEENLICMYHKSDRRRTSGAIRATLSDMSEDMAALARQALISWTLWAMPTLKRSVPFHRRITQAGKSAGRGGLYVPCVRRFFRVIQIHSIFIVKCDL